MTYVVTENCINCVHTTCVEICPTDAFHEGPNFLVINPVECIHCNLCPSLCPVDAIYEDDQVPSELSHFIQINDELSQIWPNITEEKNPPIDADKWDGIPNKLAFLQR